MERTAGGKAKSESKKQKLEQFRKDQEDYFSSVVDKMLQVFYDDGTIQPDELDDGVISLCKRHSANVVQAALERYVESDGRHKDNSSAYLTCLVGKMAAEGIFEKTEEEQRPSKKSRTQHKAGESMLEKEGVNMRAVEKGAPNAPNDVSKIFPSFSLMRRYKSGVRKHLPQLYCTTTTRSRSYSVGGNYCCIYIWSSFFVPEGNISSVCRECWRR